MRTGKKVYKKKERNIYSKKRKPIIFIATEGRNKTETNYIKSLCRDNERIVKFAYGDDTDPVNMVDKLKERLAEEDYDTELGDKAYCVFDMDIDPKKNKEVEEAEKNARRNGIELIVSAPCLEVWFIAHFTFSTKKFNSNAEVISDLRKHLKDYKKNEQDIYEKTYDKLEEAIKNAIKLEETCVKNGYKKHTVEFSPSTEIYKIVNEIRRKP